MSLYKSKKEVVQHDDNSKDENKSKSQFRRILKFLLNILENLHLSKRI
jgi:hypothetical protein